MANFVSHFEKWGRRRCRFRPSWPYYAYLVLCCFVLWIESGVRRNFYFSTSKCFSKNLQWDQIVAFLKLVYEYIVPMEDGGVDGTVIDCRQNKFGQMADFPPLLTFWFLTYKNLTYLKLNLRSCGTHGWIKLTQLYLRNMWTHN